ncbi:MAG: hypothetical protein FWB72_01320 [Firmicutes bacterium]|nr:hypothetical protein [Bacillota bacterium]
MAQSSTQTNFLVLPNSGNLVTDAQAQHIDGGQRVMDNDDNRLLSALVVNNQDTSQEWVVITGPGGTAMYKPGWAN